MPKKKSNILLFICSEAKAKYLAFEDTILSQVLESLFARSLRGLFRKMSVVLSGCFVARVASENRYFIFASGSLLVQNLRAIIYSLGRSLSEYYGQSLLASFFSMAEATVRDVNWKSAKRDSWFLKKIYHA